MKLKDFKLENEQLEPSMVNINYWVKNSETSSELKNDYFLGREFKNGLKTLPLELIDKELLEQEIEDFRITISLDYTKQ